MRLRLAGMHCRLNDPAPLQYAPDGATSRIDLRNSLVSGRRTLWHCRTCSSPALFVYTLGNMKNSEPQAPSQQACALETTLQADMLHHGACNILASWRSVTEHLRPSSTAAQCCATVIQRSAWIAESDQDHCDLILPNLAM